MTTQEMMDVLDVLVERIVTQFNPIRIILFGSHATGQTSADSDLDMLVVMPVDTSRRSKANEIDLALSDRTIPLDVIVVTPEQFEQQKHIIGNVVREAALKGKVVYERAA